MTSEIRIYVACLAAYNNAILHGKWIDADQEPDDIHAEITAMLNASPIPEAEEWAIHDYEGFEGLRLAEYEGIDSVSKTARFIAEHGTLGAEVLAYYSDIEEAKKVLEEDYAGEYRCVADFAEGLTEDTTDIPQLLQYYIDYELMGRDMEMSGDIFTVETGYQEVHVFWSR